MSVRGYLDELLVEMTSLDVNLSRVKHQRKSMNLLDVIQCKTSYLNNLNRMYKHIDQLDKEYVRFASPSNNVNVTAGIDLHDDFSSSHGDL
ncbi:hypothetical protein Scep_019006 [Stephania cephalantha]|uniref:Uncharacterized protein n=1 Tax=Stephania cephalantha TaxID=152367 RepID=A0AAP0NKU6_9MAGN